MDNWLNRTEMLIGKEALDKLKNSTVAVFGIGGVGSYAVEALARAGVGKLVLIDNDLIDVTNINRQLIATTNTVGKAKVDVAKERVLQINPNIDVTTYQKFFDETTKNELVSPTYSYIIDCIDSVDSKVDLIETAQKMNIPIISSMGTGNKLDPTKFEVADIYDTSVCPLAKVMRKKLKSRQILHLKVVFSKEEITVKNSTTPSSISFVPSVAGLILAGETIKDLI